MAGAEGLEPSARGFGVDVDWHKPTQATAMLSLLRRIGGKDPSGLMLY